MPRPLPYRLLFLTFFAFLIEGWAQHNVAISAVIDPSCHEIQIGHRIEYHNGTGEPLTELYFTDWNNSYSTKKSKLSQRFAEEFKRNLYLANAEDRGHTNMVSIVDDAYMGLDWEYTDEPDILRIDLKAPIPPGASQILYLTYTLKLPNARFTSYGFRPEGGYYLKDWYLTPAVRREGEWRLYPNKNLDDQYTDPADVTIDLIYPSDLYVASNYAESGKGRFPDGQHVTLRGENRRNCVIALDTENRFTRHVTPYLTVTSDIDARRFDEISQGVSINRVSRFLTQELGRYPHPNLLASEIEYNKTPLYGLNQLPSFVRPYQEQFQFEMTFLKTALWSYLEETLHVDVRKERWILDAIAHYMMIRYVDEYYPDQKLIGKLARVWGIRGFHLAEMSFNEQYNFLHMLAVRRNIDQALTTPNDSLIKFNQKIANRYKAGLGMAYLAAYVGKPAVDSAVMDFYHDYKIRPYVGQADFRSSLERYAQKDIDWFFDEYVSTRKRIDYRIKKVRKTEDSISLTIKNKRGTNVPISLFGLRNDSVVSRYWFTDIDSSRTFQIPRLGEDRLVLNYDKVIPEFNQRDNWKTLNGFFSSNRKLRFQFFKDTEDPYRNQVFFIPIANFNVYDGITPGMRLYNKTFLERQFNYDIAPTYSFLERTMVGGASVSYRKYLKKSGLYFMNFFLGGNSSHFQTNSRFTTVTPAVSMGWRPDDLISNERQFLLLRYRNVFRSIDPSIADEIDTDPDYQVLNLRYNYIDNDILDFKSGEVDFQYSEDFVKVSAEFDYRKLFENNTQLNLRLFAGKFIRNDTDSDFFSFALDRPTDYLFDLNYLGRSEDTGLFSQQIIIAEGGFKSQLAYPFANDWMVTMNGSVNLYRWIELYGDVGLLKNRPDPTRFVYDSGIRLNLVTDYFELYLPLYSNNGWEIGQPDYGRTIRFVITVSPKTLTGLFTRKWF